MLMPKRVAVRVPTATQWRIEVVDTSGGRGVARVRVWLWGGWTGLGGADRRIGGRGRWSANGGRGRQHRRAEGRRIHDFLGSRDLASRVWVRLVAGGQLDAR